MDLDRESTNTSKSYQYRCLSQADFILTIDEQTKTIADTRGNEMCVTTAAYIYKRENRLATVQFQ